MSNKSYSQGDLSVGGTANFKRANSTNGIKADIKIDTIHGWKKKQNSLFRYLI